MDKILLGSTWVLGMLFGLPLGFLLVEVVFRFWMAVGYRIMVSSPGALQ
jgi:hypothetical protein